MVYIFLADGFEEIEALTQIDYLRRAGIDIISVGICGKEKGIVVGAHGIKVVPDIDIEKAKTSKDLEMVILPGGLGGVDGIKNSEKAVEIIRFCAENGKNISAICAAPTILAEMGLLDGRNAVCFPSMEGGLNMCRQPISSERVVKDGKIITAKAAGVSEEFSFALIEALKGFEASQNVRRSIYAR